MHTNNPQSVTQLTYCCIWYSEQRGVQTFQKLWLLTKHTLLYQSQMFHFIWLQTQYFGTCSVLCQFKGQQQTSQQQKENGVQSSSWPATATEASLPHFGAFPR